MKRARLFRYRGIVVRLYNGRLEPVRVRTGPTGPGSMVPADGRFPRATRSFAPLPKHMRRTVRQMEARAAREERLKSMGQPLGEGERPAWGELGKIAPAASAVA